MWGRIQVGKPDGDCPRIVEGLIVIQPVAINVESGHRLPFSRPDHSTRCHRHYIPLAASSHCLICMSLWKEALVRDNPITPNPDDDIFLEVRTSWN